MQDKNLEDILSSLYNKRKKILKITIISTVIIAVFSLFLKNYYESKTVFFALSPDVTKPEYIFGQSTGSMNYYGSKDDINRIFSLATDAELFLFMIDSFDLYERYDINKDSKAARTKVIQKFKKHYKVHKTEYGGIEIAVEDQDPIVASAMANAARNFIDKKSTSLMKNIQQTTYNVLKDNVNEKTYMVQSISDSLRVLKDKYGIYNPSAQSESLSTLIAETQAMLTREKGRLEILESNPSIKKDSITYIVAKVRGLENELNSLVGRDTSAFINLEKFSRGFGPYEILNDQLSKSTEELSYLLQKVQRVESTMKSNFSSILIFEEATIPEIKKRPRRSMLVLGSGLFVFFMLSFYFVCIDIFGNLNIVKKS